MRTDTRRTDRQNHRRTAQTDAAKPFTPATVVEVICR